MANASFKVPAGATAKFSIIDTGSRISNIPTDRLMTPPLAGFEKMPKMPSLCFLVEDGCGRKAIFDLSVPPDYPHLAKSVADRLSTNGYVIEPAATVAEVLESHEVQLEDIGSIIWSHWHWDHLGNPSQFPNSTELVVGPGFKHAFLPPYPEDQQSPVRQEDIAGRSVREISFEHSDLNVGQFQAHDFFGDGSFYLVNTPGHAIGHLGGLVRTTMNPDTFAFLGGDLCHHSSEMRPSKYMTIPLNILGQEAQEWSRYSCPGAITEQLQKQRSRALDEALFDPARGVPLEDACETVRKAQEADGQNNVLFIYAHDREIPRVVDLFPLSANKWYSKGWRSKLLWAFLKDFRNIT